MVNRSSLEEAVLAGLRPAKEERDHVCGIAQRILEKIRQGGKAEGMVVGSIARHTWVKGDRDLDVFMLFDPSLSREQLEAEGLALARSIAAAFTDNYHEKYAEHPYINATIDDVDVDLVPCYKVESAARIQSAVDRTPFHTRYITEKINGLIDDVLLLKRFAKAGGIYGSDQMTEGFSGYLCELLVLHYGGFTPLLNAAAEWKPRTLIDVENHVAKEFDEPLVMIDPVDPKRNVAAAVSVDRMAEFVELARGYLESPSAAFFELPQEPPIAREDLEKLLDGRGTSLFAITFATPPYIEEIVVPQLKRSTLAISEFLERNGFAVHHADYRMGKEESLILVELLVSRLPAIRSHAGPPVWNRVNAEKFRAKYLMSDLPGPYIVNGRYETEVPREFRHAGDLLRSEGMLQVSLGKHVRQAFENGWKVHEGPACWSPGFASFIGGFFGRCSPLVSLGKGK
ncbi:CCA tRNA nucleotidyltransferase [Methanoregula formicica]|uniref:CCA-adding enzyme n=1 Tax=Methanoregula formicica (strain DSM 22288 / NBRC 105244 / SMSP) TaxID=593750 RepID=L0HGP3_METFS|nr:CCA tRNA nucleotidyltransferase [Methanoregula formicica]AGB02234.1 CCA-adding enzyme [Methanoregula formicica SMSP]